MSVQCLNGLWCRNQPKGRPVGQHLLVINLMPDREATERQWATLLATSAVSCTLTFAVPATHRLRHRVTETLATYYQLSAVRAADYDGIIITGAPVEHLSLAAVDYWEELRAFVAQAEAVACPLLFVCWAAIAFLTARGDYVQENQPHKILGLYAQAVRHDSPLTAGLTHVTMPQSRWVTLWPRHAATARDICVDQRLGVTLVDEPDRRSTYILGHLEYDETTLWSEYLRDREHRTVAAPQQTSTQLAAWHQTRQTIYHRWLAGLAQSTTALAK